MGEYPGYFVAIEGLDGSGKTTQAQNVVEFLRKENYNAIVTQEPTHGQIGKVLRLYLSDSNTMPEVDALLFAADRIEHYYEEILPALEQGKIVVTDRYVSSSVAYQTAQGAEMDWVIEVNKHAPPPDMIIYLDVSIDTAIERLQGSARDKFEKFESRIYLERIDSLYRKIGDNFRYVDAEKERGELTANLGNLIISELTGQAGLTEFFN